MDGGSSLSGLNFCIQLFNLALILLILILILTIDEAVGEDAAEQEGDGWHVDCDVVDGHLHPSDDSVLTRTLEILRWF